VGDVVGRPGRRAVEQLLPGLIAEHRVDFSAMNVENAAGGAGLTHAVAEALFAAGADILTGGNHIWANKEILRFIDEEDRVLRPANFPPGTPGRGAGVFRSRRGVRVFAANLLGRVFMDPIDNPFRAIDALLAGAAAEPIRIVDFHAEATSEKVAMGWYVDGRVSAVFGTHTHVVTADERILPRGTAYITDVGMTGPHDSVIGVRKERAISRMVTGLPAKFETAADDVRLNAVLVACDPRTGRALGVERVQRRLEGT
jgi:hypothetical protein